MEDDRFLTVEEFSQAARIGYRAALRLAHSGAIRTVRFGKSIRIPLSELKRQSFHQTPLAAAVQLAEAAQIEPDLAPAYIIAAEKLRMLAVGV